MQFYYFYLAYTYRGREADDKTALKKELQEAQATIQEYEQSAKEQNQHITQSKQFQQLKKMVATKNEALQALRKRLRRYEPDEADACEDEDD